MMREIDITTMTPLEALIILNKLKDAIDQVGEEGL